MHTMFGAAGGLCYAFGMDATTSSDTAYKVGRVLGIFAFAALVYFAGLGLVRLIKRRPASPKEKKIVLIVAITLTVVGLLGEAAQFMQSQTPTY